MARLTAPASPAPSRPPAPTRPPTLALALTLALLPASAFAQSQPFDDPYALPTAPRPPTLPELTHSEIEGTLETTEGAIIPTPGGVWTHAYVQRINVEVPLALRRWYVGATYEFASGGTAHTFETVGGNLELDGRTLWATTTGLGFGGGLSLVLPTASFDPTGSGAVVALNSATLRPWDVTFFTQGVYGLRPYVDVRALFGPFIAQFRQGLDMTVAPTQIGDRHFYAMTGLYLGWKGTDRVAGGIEAFEEYVIAATGVSDGARSAIVISPNVRLSLPWVQPAISVFTNIGNPLYGANESFWGFRLAFTVVYDPSAVLRVRAQDQ